MPSSASCTLVGDESPETVELRAEVLEFLLWNYNQTELEGMSDDVDSIKFEVLDRIKYGSLRTWYKLRNYSHHQSCRVSFVKYVIQEVLPQTLADGSATGARASAMSTS